MLWPLGWAISADPGSAETRAFLITIVLGIAVFLACRQVYRFKTIDYQRVNAKDGLAIVGLSWIVLSAFGALPFSFESGGPFLYGRLL